MNIWTIIIIMGVVLIGMIIGFGSFFWYYMKVYKYKLEYYENVAGVRPERTRILRMRLIRIAGSVGEEVFWVPKIKKYFSAYGKPMAKNTYWALKNEGDGYLYNFTLKDFNLDNGKMSISPVHADVRAFHTTNQKNINERYSKPKNWPMVMMSFTIIISLIIVFAGGYVLYGKMNEGLEISNANVKNTQEVTSATASLVIALEKLQTGGSSGLVPVPTPLNP